MGLSPNIIHLIDTHY